MHKYVLLHIKKMFIQRVFWMLLSNEYAREIPYLWCSYIFDATAFLLSISISSKQHLNNLREAENASRDGKIKHFLVV